MISTAATEELRRRFENIRDETKLYANTANRIGNALLALLSFFEGAPFPRKDVDENSPGCLSFLNQKNGDALPLRGSR